MSLHITLAGTDSAGNGVYRLRRRWIGVMTLGDNGLEGVAELGSELSSESARGLVPC